MTLISSRLVPSPPDDRSPRYALEPNGVFRIDRFDHGPAFASFLPGIGGPAGVPLWCFYVNRGQCVVSFGVRDKDHAIAEFLPATAAYQLASLQGFRTFIKIDGDFCEPFGGGPSGTIALRSMQIEPDILTISEENHEHRIRILVEYVSPVNQPLGVLLRRVTITNLANRARKFDLLDGLPIIMPAGFTDGGVKHTRRLHEAFAGVHRVGGKAVWYASRTLVRDEADVAGVDGGNFYAAAIVHDARLRNIEPVVDPHIIFGAEQDMMSPREFIAHSSLDRDEQIWENRLPCAFASVQRTLAPSESVELIALIGHAASESLLLSHLAQFETPAEVQHAFDQSRRFIRSLTQPALIASSQPALDAYSRQSYLDNLLRGGEPLLLPSREGPILVHAYARRHGDLERDYNYFQLPDEPLSAGSGNYRDILQNRRCDVWHHPELADRELRAFASLIQADGYNPLAVEGYLWVKPDDVEADSLCPSSETAARAAWRRLLAKPLRPGALLAWAIRHGIDASGPPKWFFDTLAACSANLRAHGHEGGYWIDHWTYLVDMLEALAGIFPDRIAELLTTREDVTWFDEGVFVLPRNEKYVRRGDRLIQLHAIRSASQNPDRKGGAAPHSTRRTQQADTVALPPVTLLAKLVSLAAIKAVSFDYACRGIEMEAGRPSWNDAMNGLPGLFGSCARETVELARLAGLLRKLVATPPDTRLPTVVADFIEAAAANVAQAYDWGRAASLREHFREQLRMQPGGDARFVSGALIARLLSGIEARATTAAERCVDPQTGLLHTYFVNRPVLRDGTADGDPVAAIEHFESEPLPLSLEGQVHHLRMQRGEQAPEAIDRIHQAVRNSPLYDAPLAMYRLNASLAACPTAIGRARTFPRSWLENESVWLHISYKYMLELLRSDRHEHFFADAATMLVPFMEPAVYGRSTLENSSFLGASVNTDARTHGRGFVARLSGSTAEFLQMRLLLMLGSQPFRVASGELEFAPEPALPAAWFTDEARTLTLSDRTVELPADALAFVALGQTLFVYHNPERRDTYGENAVRPVRFSIDGGPPIDGDAIRGPLAASIRDGRHQRIDIELGKR